MGERRFADRRRRWRIVSGAGRRRCAHLDARRVVAFEVVGHTLYVEVGAGENSQRHARTAALPIGSDGLPSESAISVPDAALILHAELNLAMSADPSVYAFVKFETRRNIYRIPLRD